MAHAKNLLGLLNTKATGDELRTVIEMMIAEGRLQIIGDRDGEPLYALTDEGRRYADEVIFPELGVTPGEAMAFVAEHAREPFPRLGLTARELVDLEPEDGSKDA